MICEFLGRVGIFIYGFDDAQTTLKYLRNIQEIFSEIICFRNVHLGRFESFETWEPYNLGHFEFKLWNFETFKL